jgi:hypothetical protein
MAANNFSALALLNVAVKRIEDRIKVIIVLDILIDYPSH